MKPTGTRSHSELAGSRLAFHFSWIASALASVRLIAAYQEARRRRRERRRAERLSKLKIADPSASPRGVGGP